MGGRPSEAQKKVCYYKWEFLRRNPEYREDYKEFLELCSKSDWDPKSDTVRYETFEKNPDRQKRRKYGIAFLEHPAKSIPLEKFEENPFWPIIGDLGLKRPTWPSTLKPHYPKGEPVIRIFTNQFKEKIAVPLALLIDLTCPKREIMVRVKKLVDDAIEERKKLGLAVHRGRKRFDLYEQYLKVWDLRKKGLAYKQIAAELYPGEPLDYEIEVESDPEKYEERLAQLRAEGKPEAEAYEIADREFGVGGRKNPVIQRIIMQYKEAESLVRKGYLEII